MATCYSILRSAPADTVKERAELEEMYQRGNCPWMIWDAEPSGMTTPTDSTPPAPAPPLSMSPSR